MSNFYLWLFLRLIQCILSPDRVNVVSLVRGEILELRVFRDLVDFLEHLEVMDPRSVDDIETDFSYSHCCF